MNHKSAQARLAEILARQQALAVEIGSATESRRLKIRDELVGLDDERLKILKEIQAADPYLVERTDANLDTQDITWVTKEGAGRLECPIDSERYFPFTGLPARKFDFGNHVQMSLPDGVFDITYIFKGTIFGCEYHHPVWAENNSLTLCYPGWVYLVVWAWKETSGLTMPSSCLEVDYCKEDELSLVEDLEEVSKPG